MYLSYFGNFRSKLTCRFWVFVEKDIFEVNAFQIKMYFKKKKIYIYIYTRYRYSILFQVLLSVWVHHSMKNCIASKLFFSNGLSPRVIFDCVVFPRRRTVEGIRDCRFDDLSRTLRQSLIVLFFVSLE